jgi:uncharacterized damage-inducible protein DinB
VRNGLGMEFRGLRESYREGAVGALMDEYERAVWELRHLAERIAETDAARVVDPETKDEDCRSVQTIMSHVVNAGYGYADLLRKVFSIPSTRPPKALLSHRESVERLDAVLAYTAETLEGRWRMTYEELAGAVINSGWGVRYDAEQLLEHAVVHVLRHRRQIEKFMRQGLIPTPPDLG